MEKAQAQAHARTVSYDGSIYGSHKLHDVKRYRSPVFGGGRGTQELYQSSANKQGKNGG